MKTNKKKEAEQIINNHRNDTDTTPIEILDRLKQKLAAVVRRLARYKKSRDRKLHNQTFYKNQKNLYRTLNKKDVAEETVREYPSRDVIEDFWGNLWSQQTAHKHSKTILTIKQESRNIPTMYLAKITTADIRDSIKNCQN